MVRRRDGEKAQLRVTTFGTFRHGSPPSYSDGGAKPEQGNFRDTLAQIRDFAPPHPHLPNSPTPNPIKKNGGERGIRTPGAREDTAVFKTAPFGQLRHLSAVGFILTSICETVKCVANPELTDRMMNRWWCVPNCTRLR